jgi:hypothetical protein
MKKLFILMSFFTIISFSASAQAYDEGVNIFDVGVGFGNAYGGYGYNWGTRGYGASIPVSASYEIGFHEYFSAGPYVAFATRTFGIGTEYRQNFFGIGGKGSFHYVRLLNDALDMDIDEDKLDLYLSVYVGAELYSDNDDNRFDNTTDVDFGTVVGGRYMFSDNMGVYTELGYAALAVWTVGLSLNL